MRLLDLPVADAPRAIDEGIVLPGLSEECGRTQDIRILNMQGFEPWLIVVGDVPAFEVDNGGHRTGQMFHG